MRHTILTATIAALALAGCMDDSAGYAVKPDADERENLAPDEDGPAGIERCTGPLRIDSVEAHGPAGGVEGPDLLSVRVTGNLCDVSIPEHQFAPIQLRGTGGSSPYGISDRCHDKHLEVDPESGAFVARWVIGICGSGADVTEVQIHAVAQGASPDAFPVAARAAVRGYATAASGGPCDQFQGEVCADTEICGPDIRCAPPAPPEVRNVAVWMNPTTGDTHVDLDLEDRNGDATGQVEVVYRDSEGRELGAAMLQPGGWGAAPFAHAAQTSATARGEGLPRVDAPHAVAEVSVTAIDQQGLGSDALTAVPLTPTQLSDGAACDQQFNALEACGPDSVCGDWVCQAIPDGCDAFGWRDPAHPTPNQIADGGPGGDAQGFQVDLPPGRYALNVTTQDTPFTVMMRRHCAFGSLDSQLLWGLTVGELNTEFRVSDGRPLWLLIDSAGPYTFDIQRQGD